MKIEETKQNTQLNEKKQYTTPETHKHEMLSTVRGSGGSGLYIVTLY